MSNTRQRPNPPVRRTIRCAIYTRKSTEEGLEQEFNTLDAQRESGENYIRSMAGEGWQCLPDRYDDGGFTGGNMERPALKRLMADIEAGRVDCVVVYKVDRLSRSLLDFAKMMETFDRWKVAFVSVTQQFNTGNSMGRLVLNVLLSFAQFEREIISERTRDKIAATRRKGKWAGGWPILGYDVDPNNFRLVVNENEAERVRTIFQWYLDGNGLMDAVAKLEQRGWPNKLWTTRKGLERGGRPFDKNSLWHLLTNVAYTGKVRYKTEIHPGEHKAIVEPEIWQRVQVKLQHNGRTGGALMKNKFGAILKGLVHCVPCGCAITPTHSTRGGSVRYRYYVCISAQKKGWHTCPSKSIPAVPLEEYVVAQVARIGRDQALVTETLREANLLSRRRTGELTSERLRLERELNSYHGSLRELVNGSGGDGSSGLLSSRLADLQERIATSEKALSTVDTELAELKKREVTEEEVVQAIGNFESIWATLTPHERTSLMRLLIERIDYDGRDGSISIGFHRTGLTSLANLTGGTKS